MDIPSPRTRKRARLEIIPLIDIIFFLLATFVMVSLSMVQQKGISVTLPVAATGKEQSTAEATVISVDAEGKLFFNKDPIERKDLAARLAALKRSNPEATVYINGDEKTSFGAAMSVLDEVRLAGLSRVSIATRHPK